MLAFARCLIVTLYFFGVSLTCLFLAILCPFNLANAHRFLRWLSPFSLKVLGVRVEVEGEIPAQRPLIIVGNHQHTFDVFIYGVTLPAQTVAVGKKSILAIPLFGQLFWLTGQILLDRKNKAQAIGALDIVKERATKEKLNVLIFPEGTRSRGRGLLPFKKGAFHLAVAMGAPIVTVVTNSYLKSYRYSNWKNPPIKVRILPPLYADPTLAGEEAVQELLQRTRQLVEETQNHLDRG